MKIWLALLGVFITLTFSAATQAQEEGSTPGAIANAIAQVTGARVHELPMTPARVWEAMQR